MKGPYDDILYLSYTGSGRAKRMSMTERGAQFSPFAALTGYDAAIRETGRLTDRQVELDADEQAILDERLRFLVRLSEAAPEVTVVYFVPDEWKSGGAYKTVTAPVRKVDIHRQALLLADGAVIPFSRLRQLQGEVFRKIEGICELE